ncbi:MAG: agmatinase [candidate division Zixibacteria bacterium]|nr:agmatinase [candidate division Zixibacteria bacterium]
MKLASYDKAKAVILPIPYDLTLTYESGARLGPQAIINASRQLETYDDELGLDPSEIGIATLPEMEQVVSGPVDMQKAIYQACINLLDDNKYVMSLGGEHSITAALVKAHKMKYPDLSVLQIDAHADLRNSYQGSKFSHACVMARVAEHASFLAVGIRSFCGRENRNKHDSDTFSPAELREDPKKFEKSIAKLSENVYITIDLDGLDPSVMPAVGTPEPGGLSWDEVIRIIGTLASRKKIVGADVVELSPKPGLIYADFTAAKLAYKVIAKSFFKG